MSLKKIVGLLYKGKKGSERRELPPWIYRVEESESYRCPEIDKEFIKKILDSDSTSTYIESFEALSGIKLEEKDEKWKKNLWEKAMET